MVLKKMNAGGNIIMDLYIDCCIHMNTSNLKWDGGFHGEFAFVCFVIFKDLLSNNVIMVDAWLFFVQWVFLHLTHLFNECK